MIYTQINTLIKRALEVNLIEETDINYVRNQVLAQLKLTAFPENESNTREEAIPDILDNIIAYGIEQAIIEDVFDDKEVLTANIMNCFIARPSVINDRFRAKYALAPEAATNYFYDLSKNSNYIQMNRIKKNMHFKADTIYSEMDITINLSKPEKDPKQIEREKNLKSDISFPTCVLCVENEGYEGRTAYPARANHRVIQIMLDKEAWYLQYSPYVYYNEHSILLSGQHLPMVIDQKTFERLLTFIEQFPHYFIGSNADLPIVGGSILSHNHYQAGNYSFPMDHAKNLFSFELKHFPSIEASLLEWPLTTIRMRSNSQQKLVAAATHILTTWQNYDDEAASVHAFTGDTPHNTVTPIARMRGELFELDVVLRNNRTTEEYPDGIFHPHKDVHHIKKENIGLIEVMGLAVLPARLKNELDTLKQYLAGEDVVIETYHQAWADTLIAQYGRQTDEAKVNEMMEKELGNKFARVLQDAGVLKDKAAYMRFVKALNEDNTGA